MRKFFTLLLAAAFLGPAYQATRAEEKPAAEAKPVAEGSAKEPAAEAKPAAAGVVKEAPAKEEPAKDAAAKPEEKPAVGKKKNAAAAEPGSVEYFGVKAEGNRFVFVLDNSNSMAVAKFDTACYQLVQTVHSLTEKQEFYVVLFSDTAYPLFHPTPAKGYVRATSQNKSQLYEWLKTVQCVRGTNAKEASARALAAKPDAIFLLSDGAFTDDTLEFMLAQPKANTKVHTLAFKGKEGAKVSPKSPLAQIADHFDGTVTGVGISPQFAAIERPTNSKKGDVWGLGLVKKEKAN